MSTLKWSSYGTYTTGIGGVAAAPTLKNLADNGRVLSAAIDNTTNLYMYADFDLLCRFAASADIGGYLALYLIPSVDGTNYVDGSDAVVPSPSTWVGNFAVQATDTAQRIGMLHVLVTPGKFKLLIDNQGGQALTNTDNENVLSYRMYNEVVV